MNDKKIKNEDQLDEVLRYTSRPARFTWWGQEAIERLYLAEWLSILFDDSERDISGGDLVDSLAEFFKHQRGGPPRHNSGDPLPNGNYYDPSLVSNGYLEFLKDLEVVFGHRPDRDEPEPETIRQVIGLDQRRPARTLTQVLGLEDEPVPPIHSLDSMVELIEKGTERKIAVLREGSGWNFSVMVEGRLSQSRVEGTGATALEAVGQLWSNIVEFLRGEEVAAREDWEAVEKQLSAMRAFKPGSEPHE